MNSTIAANLLWVYSQKRNQSEGRCYVSALYFQEHVNTSGMDRAKNMNGWFLLIY